MDSRFQAACEAAAERFEVPALVAAVAAGGEVSTVAVGCDAGTRFRVASVTKPLTATLALTLLDPEEHAGVWPPDVRIRHLLAHTSGFDCELVERDLARFGDGDDALARAVAELPGVRRWLGVEQVWSYANTGYWLVGHRAAERAGTSFEDAFAAHVLRPAGLEASDFGEPDLPGTGPDAEEGPYPRARRPSGGLVSTAADVLRFARWHLTSPPGPRMRIVHARPTAGVYGLGLAGERPAGVPVWGHGGSWGGFQSSLLIVPDRDAAFVGLTNSGGGKRALRLVEDEFLERVVGARRRVPETVEVPRLVLEAFAGSYANREDWFDVELSDGGLTLTVGEERRPARPIAPAVFEITEGETAGDRFDFPREGFLRAGGRLAERVA